MILNLFFTNKQIIEQKYTAPKSQNVQAFINTNVDSFDPIIKLLTDLKTRKEHKVIISRDQDIIPSVVNDKTKESSVFVTVNENNALLSVKKPTRLPTIFRSQRSPNFPTAQNKSLLHQLKRVPVYVVVNNKSELIVAVPRSNDDANIINWLSSKYYNWFVWKEDEGPVSLGLFFMNKTDAETYLHEVCKKDPQGAEKSGLRVEIVGLDKFYQMNRTSAPGFQAKLIADLEEIGKLISDYKHNPIYQVHPKQQHSKNNFQGTPIYKVKTTFGKCKLTKKSKLIRYKISTSESKDYVFFRLKDVHSAWGKFKSDNINLDLPTVPQIEIYNLENYLLDLERSEPQKLDSISFIPTQESYKIVQEYFKSTYNKDAISFKKMCSKILSEKSKDFKNIYKGLVWLLTSDTLPTEDNGW